MPSVKPQGWRQNTAATATKNVRNVHHSASACLSLRSPLDRSEGPDEEAAATGICEGIADGKQPHPVIIEDQFFLFCLFCFCCCSRCSAHVAASAVRFRLVVFVVVAAAPRLFEGSPPRQFERESIYPSIQLVPSSIAVLIWSYLVPLGIRR